MQKILACSSSTSTTTSYTSCRVIGIKSWHLKSQQELYLLCKVCVTKFIITFHVLYTDAVPKVTLHYIIYYYSVLIFVTYYYLYMCMYRCGIAIISTICSLCIVCDILMYYWMPVHPIITVLHVTCTCSFYKCKLLHLKKRHFWVLLLMVHQAYTLITQLYSNALTMLYIIACLSLSLSPTQSSHVGGSC